MRRLNFLVLIVLVFASVKFGLCQSSSSRLDDIISSESEYVLPVLDSCDSIYFKNLLVNNIDKARLIVSHTTLNWCVFIDTYCEMHPDLVFVDHLFFNENTLFTLFGIKIKGGVDTDKMTTSDLMETIVSISKYMTKIQIYS